MHKAFAETVLSDLLAAGDLRCDDAIVAVCADERDAELFAGLGFTNVTLSNLTRLEDRQVTTEIHDYSWAHEDAQSLSFGDDSFDVAFVSAGLHHCQWPHRAVAEMYRVSKKAIVILEARDSALMRLAVKVGLAGNHEINKTLATTYEFGGMNGGHLPNYVYRWTERDFEKTILALDPTGQQRFEYAYDFRLSRRLNPILRAALMPALWAMTRLAKRQGNSFAMIAFHPDVVTDRWPWLRLDDGGLSLDPAYVSTMKKIPND